MFINFGKRNALNFSNTLCHFDLLILMCTGTMHKTHY